MSLFIGLLAFPADPVLQDQVKIGVLAGSLASAVVGVLVLLLAPSCQRARSGGTGPARAPSAVGASAAE